VVRLIERDGEMIPSIAFHYIVPSTFCSLSNKEPTRDPKFQLLFASFCRISSSFRLLKSLYNAKLLLIYVNQSYIHVDYCKHKRCHQPFASKSRSTIDSTIKTKLDSQSLDQVRKFESHRTRSTPSTEFRTTGSTRTLTLVVSSQLSMCSPYNRFSLVY
jgi:hypothetical protein